MVTVCLKTREDTGRRCVERGLCDQELASAGPHVASALNAGQHRFPTIHHRTTIYAHLRRPNTYMGLQKWLSGLKKKLKRRFVGCGHELEGIRADVSEERVDSIGSLPRAEHYVIAEEERSRPQSGNENDAGRGRVDSMDPTPGSDDSEFVPISESRGDGGREAATEVREVTETGLNLSLGAECVVEGAPSRGQVDGEETDRVDPSPSAPPILRGGGSESTQITCYFHSLALITPQTTSATLHFKSNRLIAPTGKHRLRTHQVGSLLCLPWPN